MVGLYLTSVSAALTPGEKCRLDTRRLHWRAAEVLVRNRAEWGWDVCVQRTVCKSKTQGPREARLRCAWYRQRPSTLALKCSSGSHGSASASVRRAEICAWAVALTCGKHHVGFRADPDLGGIVQSISKCIQWPGVAVEAGRHKKECTGVHMIRMELAAYETWRRV